jgi:hypothetical protein
MPRRRSRTFSKLLKIRSEPMIGQEVSDGTIEIELSSTVTMRSSKRSASDFFNSLSGGVLTPA